MDLRRLYILTGKGTASASELTITGLDAYMDIILIGDTTVGKYVASATLQPKDIKHNDPAIANWAIQPIIYAYANSTNVIKKKFIPHHLVKEDIFDPTPLGDIHEILLSKALEEITGVAPSRAKSAPQAEPFAYQIVGTGFSRYDKFKGNAIVEQLKINGK
jgi:hypothetical protein